MKFALLAAFVPADQIPFRRRNFPANGTPTMQLNKSLKRRAHLALLLATSLLWATAGAGAASAALFEFISGNVDRGNGFPAPPPVTGSFVFTDPGAPGGVIFERLSDLAVVLVNPDGSGLGLSWPDAGSSLLVDAVLVDGDFVGLTGTAVHAFGSGAFTLTFFLNPPFIPLVNDTGLQIRFPNVATVWTTFIPGSGFENLGIPAVPEPAPLALLGIGLAGLGFFGRRKIVA